MGVIFSWLSAPGQINEDDWSRFLNNYSVVFVVLVAFTIAGIVAYYRHAAKSLKIYSPSDVFRAYTPLRALWISVAGALLACGLAAIIFYQMLATSDGLLQTACIMLLLAGLVSALVSYLLIRFLKDLTPPRYRSRVAP